MQSLTRDIEGEVVSVDDNLNPAGPFGESLGTELGSNENVFDHEPDILLFQRTGLLPVLILTVGQINARCKARTGNTYIFSGMKTIPLKEVPAASPEN